MIELFFPITVWYPGEEEEEEEVGGRRGVEGPVWVGHSQPPVICLKREGVEQGWAGAEGSFGQPVRRAGHLPVGSRQCGASPPTACVIFGCVSFSSLHT